MIFQAIKKYHIILASNSPRRKRLLEDLGIDFKLIKQDNVDENVPASILTENVAEYLAVKKSELLNITDNEICITADTVVCLGEKILNKPKDYNDAIQMLESLSGRQHVVITGVCIKSAYNMYSFSSLTKVWFGNLNSEEIEYYVGKYKPYDKAGAYGIQEWIGYIGVEKIEGSYFNVMGLPVQKLYTELNNFIEKENNY
ncbi:Maf family nucleotide pyrophosphatase [Bacteroidota bacterium]